MSLPSFPDLPWSRPTRVAATLLFLLAILVPGAAFFFPQMMPKQLLEENRKLKKIPHFKWSSAETFPRRFDEAYSDQFGFRDWLVRANSRLRIFALGVSPTKLVLIGSEGWLFFGRRSPTTVAR